MYKPIQLKEAFPVKKIITVHYFEYSKNFSFDGECHDFWELVYVDKGEVDIITHDRTFRLERGQFTFHKPNEWHSIKSTGEIAPNLIIISFICTSENMSFFNEKIIKTTDVEKDFLAIIIKESNNAFKPPFNDPTTKTLVRRNKNTAVHEQLIKLAIENLLISLYDNAQVKSKDYSAIKNKSDKNLVDSTIAFLNDSIGKKLRFEVVCENLNVSGSTLKNAFKEKTGFGVMEYFVNLKIDTAKLYIRQENMNFTQIAQKLGYETLHHFTKQFKQKTNMTPTQYSLSVKVSVS